MTNNKSKSPAPTKTEQKAFFTKQIGLAAKLYSEHLGKLQALKSKGEYQELIEGWFGIDNPDEEIDAATDLLYEFVNSTELTPESEMFERLTSSIRNYIVIARQIRDWKNKQKRHREVLQILHPLLSNGEKFSSDPVVGHN